MCVSCDMSHVTMLCGPVTGQFDCHLTELTVN